MKQVLLIMFLFGCFMVNGQDVKITQSIEPFKEVKGFDGLSINLIKSSENKVVISGENTDKVAVVNNDGILKIRMQIGKIFSGYKTFVDLHYAQDILIIKDIYLEIHMQYKEISC